LQTVLIAYTLGFIMVTRLDKSSKSRFGQEYMLLWRVSRELGWKVIDRALNGDESALARIEKFAWKGRKKPALVRWVAEQRNK
jgi:hypothetical protein